MQMSKKTNKFDYPHPLIKNLYKPKSYTPQNISQYLKQKPTFYDNKYTFSPSIKTIISPKLFRISNTKIVPNQKFGILLQPFCQTQQVQMVRRSKEDQQSWKCKSCQSLLNYQCQSVSLYQVNCKICKTLQSISLDVKNTLENVPCCYQIFSEDLQDVSLVYQKNICFVIEASEFNYNFRVSQVIQSCLSSLKSTLSRNDLQRKFSQAVTEDQDSNYVQKDQMGSEQINQQIRYNISFVMFNDKNIFVVNQTTNDVIIFNESFLQASSQNHHSVIEFDDFFKPIEQISKQTFGLVSEILYQSYLKNTSCLDVTTKFIYEWVDKFMLNSQRKNTTDSLNQNVKRQVEYKFFVNTLKFTKLMFAKTQSVSSKEINRRQIFQNVSNMIASNLPSSKNKQIILTMNNQSTEQQGQTQSILTLGPNFSFFYLPQYHTKTFNSMPQNQVIKKLNNNLYKMYPQTEDQSPKNKIDLFNQLYYDLFENLSSKQYFDVKVSIICSEKVQILGVGNQCFGYNDCSSGLVKIQSTSQIGKSFSFYTSTLKCLDTTNTLPIDLKILPLQTSNTKKQSVSETQHFVQINLKYTKPFILNEQPLLVNFQRVFHTEVTSLNRAINYRHHIYASLSTYVDDQTLFYFKLRWILSECHKNKTNHTIFKKLYEQMQKLSDNFKNEYGQIDFHKQYVRIFLYAFIIMKKPITNGIDEGFYYQRHLWLKGSTQCIAKSLYPRTYEIIKDGEKVQLKNIKSSPKNFKTDTLILLDNGKFLYFIIGEDNSVEEIKKIFGTCFIDQIREMTELPELLSNEGYREVIELARSYHESNFLPLKIMELFSRQFDDEVSHLLYIKDNHYKYMRQLWQMDPVPKKVR